MARKLVIIRRGKLTENTGNFTGFTSSKEKVFFPAKQIEEWIGDHVDGEGQLMPGKEIYALVDTFQYAKLDEDGEPLLDENEQPVTFVRLDAVASSPEKGRVFAIYNEDKILAAEAEADFMESIKDLKNVNVKDLLKKSLQTT